MKQIGIIKSSWKERNEGRDKDLMTKKTGMSWGGTCEGPLVDLNGHRGALSCYLLETNFLPFSIASNSFCVNVVS